MQFDKDKMTEDDEAKAPAQRTLTFNPAKYIAELVIGLVNLVMWAVNLIIRLFLKLIKVIGSSIRRVMEFLPRLISNYIPTRISNWLNQQLIYANVEMTPEEVISVTLIYSVVIAATTYIITLLMSASPVISAAAVLVSFLSMWALSFILINMLITNRVNIIEEALPDVLSIIAQNISAGMTSYDALWSAARPEFGPLAMEIQGVAKASLTGIPLTDALMGMTNHVKSAKMLRVVRLIIQGMKSGGELHKVLQAVSADIRREQNLKLQMAAETSAQVIFILFAVVIGAPLLFGVSYEFINIFSTMMTKLNVQELSKNAPQGMISMKPLAVSPQFFLTYSLCMLIISSFFGSLLIGILRTGNITQGFTTIPGLMAGSLAVFTVVRYVLDVFFSGMITF